MANGQGFKKFSEELPELSDLLCIEETWLTAYLPFVLSGYRSVQRGRQVGQGGGCCTFVNDGLSFREVVVSTESE